MATRKEKKLIERLWRKLRKAKRELSIDLKAMLKREKYEAAELRKYGPVAPRKSRS